MCSRLRTKTILGLNTLIRRHLRRNAVAAHALVVVSLADFQLKRALGDTVHWDYVKDIARRGAA